MKMNIVSLLWITRSFHWNFVSPVLKQSRTQSVYNLMNPAGVVLICKQRGKAKHMPWVRDWFSSCFFKTHLTPTPEASYSALIPLHDEHILWAQHHFIRVLSGGPCYEVVMSAQASNVILIQILRSIETMKSRSQDNVEYVTCWH